MPRNHSLGKSVGMDSMDKSQSTFPRHNECSLMAD
jgi:hypothetical protein